MTKLFVVCARTHKGGKCNRYDVYANDKKEATKLFKETFTWLEFISCTEIEGWYEGGK